MNEELKIIIKAVTDQAKKAVKEVKDEIKETSDTAKKNSKTISDSMKSIAKGATIALTSIAAITTALIAFGKSTIEVQKNISKLNAAFQASGGTAKQANEVYKNLYRFMGDSDSATEAAQNLSRITTNTKDLVEWTKILQGVYARAGDAIPIESLAEAANETIQVGKVTGVMADALNWVGVSEDAFNAKLAQTTSLSEREALVRGTLNSLYMEASNIYERNNQALLANAESQARLDIALAESGRYVLPLITSLNDLSSTLLTFLAPAIQTVITYLTAFVQMIASAISWVGSFFGMFSSKTEKTNSDVKGYKTAMDNYLGGLSNGFKSSGKGIDSNISKLKELKRQVMGFDELNVISPQNSASSGGGGGGATGGGVGAIGNLPKMPKAEDFGIGTDSFDISKFTEDLEKAKEHIKSIGVLAGIAGAAFAAWKIANFIMDIKNLFDLIDLNKNQLEKGLPKTMTKEDVEKIKKEGKELKNQLDVYKKFGGILMGIAGAFLLIKGYSDAWANGIDWGNFALTLSGIGLIVGGLYLAFGKIAAIIGTVAAGIALVVLGVKDFINNGPTIQNTILIIGGAIAVAVAAATGGLSIITSALIGVGVAIAGFTAAIILQKKPIKDVQTAQEDYKKAIDDVITAHNNYENALNSAKSAQEKLAEAEKAAGVTGKELYDGIMNGKISFEEMTEAQKEVYWAYLDNEKAQKDLKTATKELKKAQDEEKKAFWENKLAVAASKGEYDQFKESVIAAYKEGSLSADEARDLIGKSMSEMSRDTQKTFMQDLPEDIKEGLDPKQYETTAQRLSKWWDEVKTNCVKTWDDFGDKMARHFLNAKNWALEKFEKIKDSMKKIKDDSVSKFNTFADDIKSKFADAKDKAKAKFAEITSAENLGKVKDDIVKLFSNIGTKAGEAIGGAVKTAINSVITTIENRMNDAVNLINGAINLINKIPGVHVGKLGKLKLPRLQLAKGGIVDSATIAMIGERGKEAVVPLENNTEWIDKLAERIAEKSGTPTKVILKVGEKELGWATIKAINGITEQTGGLQLQL